MCCFYKLSSDCVPNLLVIYYLWNAVKCVLLSQTHQDLIWTSQLNLQMTYRGNIAVAILNEIEESPKNVRQELGRVNNWIFNTYLFLEDLQLMVFLIPFFIILIAISNIPPTRFGSAPTTPGIWHGTVDLATLSNGTTPSPYPDMLMMWWIVDSGWWCGWWRMVMMATGTGMWDIGVHREVVYSISYCLKVVSSHWGEQSYRLSRISRIIVSWSIWFSCLNLSSVKQEGGRQGAPILGDI